MEDYIVHLKNNSTITLKANNWNYVGRDGSDVPVIEFQDADQNTIAIFNSEVFAYAEKKERKV